MHKVARKGHSEVDMVNLDFLLKSFDFIFKFVFLRVRYLDLHRQVSDFDLTFRPRDVRLVLVRLDLKIGAKLSSGWASQVKNINFAAKPYQRSLHYH